MDDHKTQITAVLPARNCRKDLARCLAALNACGCPPNVIVVDDASEDGSAQMIRDRWPEAVLLEVPVHTGYAHAANLGLRLVRTKYALLIRPDLQPGRACVRRLWDVLEDGGPDGNRIFCALPHFLRADETGGLTEKDEKAGFPGEKEKPGKTVKSGKPGKTINSGEKGNPGKTEKVLRSGRHSETLAVPDGCAMYRMEALEEIGWFDERHFEGLEALDLSLRAMMYGWKTELVPGALVRVRDVSGAGTFRRQLRAGNWAYILYKHFPAPQRILGFPALKAAEAAQALSFMRAGETEAYKMARVRGKALCSLEKERREALEDGVGVWAESLPDASFLGMEDGAERIYPLFLAEKEPLSLSGLADYARMQLLLLRSFPELRSLM